MIMIVYFSLQVFVVGVNDGHLYHIWQPERGEDWTDWEDLGVFPSGEKFQSIPFILIDHDGWWEAYGVRKRERERGMEAGMEVRREGWWEVYGVRRREGGREGGEEVRCNG